MCVGAIEGISRQLRLSKDDYRCLKAIEVIEGDLRNRSV